MTTPYLGRVPPRREMIEELILARERQLAGPISALQRLRLERDLMFLRGELARIDGQDFGNFKGLVGACANQGRHAQR